MTSIFAFKSTMFNRPISGYTPLSSLLSKVVWNLIQLLPAANPLHLDMSIEQQPKEQQFRRLGIGKRALRLNPSAKLSIQAFNNVSGTKRLPLTLRETIEGQQLFPSFIETLGRLRGKLRLLSAVYGIGLEVPVIYSKSTSTSGSRSKYELNVFTGQFETVPDVNISTSTTTSTEVVYPRYLRLILYDAKTFILSQTPEPVWIGDVKSTGSSSDLRNVIDYLIVAGFTYFGEDLKEQKKGAMPETDERVKRLREEITF